MNPHIRSQLIRALLTEVDDSGPQQLVKLTGVAGQTIGEAVRAQHFGHSSNPPASAEGLILALGGGLDRAHALGLEHPQYRPTSTPSGGSVLYDANGDKITLASGNITMTSPGTVTITAPNIVLNGTVTLGGPAGSGVPASKQGTIDTAGDVDISNLATKVLVT